MPEVILPPAAETRDGLPVIDLATAPTVGSPIQTNMARARAYGPAYFQRVNGFDILFAGGVDVVTELADETRFAKFVSPALMNVREFTGDGLFTAFNHEPNWAKAHDLLMPAFALGSMRTYHPVMLKVARRLLGAWDNAAATDTPVQVAEDMTRMTLDTIGLAGFDFDFGSFDREQPHPFVDAMTRCLAWAMTKNMRDPSADHAQADEEFRADADYLASVVDVVIASRTDNPATSGDPSDLLGLMLQSRDADGTLTLDPENIRNQVITFLIAGHETTSGTLAFALYFLTKHPEVLHRVQREVDELWGADPDPEPTYEDIGRLGYTRQVLNETLRLWPAAPGFARQALVDTVIGDGIHIAAGHPALINIPMLHRDPVWGDNPELFDPARFEPEREAARPLHAFKPFGTGERACIGRQFALHEATLVLGLLAHRYRLIDHDGYELSVKQTLTIKPDGFTLGLLPRTGDDRARHPRTAVEALSAQAASGPTRLLPGTRTLLLHGSNYGACREFTQRLAACAAELGAETEVAPLDAYAGRLPDDRPVIITAASYNGQPTDDAAAFVSWLENAEAGAAYGVDYAVLGVGDRNWPATYQRIPMVIDARLAELGGTRLFERAEADASGDIAGAVHAFTVALRANLLAYAGDPASGGTAVAPQGAAYLINEVTGHHLDATAARYGLTEMTVTETDKLTSRDHPRVKQHVRLALPDGREYRTADHLTVLPANHPEIVHRAATALGVNLETVLNIVSTRPRHDGLALDRPVTVSELLTHHLELQDRPSADQLRALAAATPCPPEQHSLTALAESAVEGHDPRTALEIIEDHPSLRESLTWPTILDVLPPIRSRTYSVSSSPLVAPDHIDLMVSRLEAPARSGRGIYRGTASTYLYRVRAGDRVLARLEPCREAFRIEHGDTPVIMVAAGTGLAPFRAVIADRRALIESGTELAPALCYFGCDAPEADYLHADELQAAEEAGAVSMRPVFSEAPIDGLRFVQHRIAAEGEEIWKLLEAGAGVYVCGDGRHMAPAVRAAFQDVYRMHTPGADRAAAEDWLRGLMSERRYVEDVYAG